MNRKILLIEPNYKNKYPPMGLMKLATYFRQMGDDVRFYKGDLKFLVAELVCQELIKQLNFFFPDTYWKEFYPTLLDFIQFGRFSSFETESIFSDTIVLEILKEYRKKYKEKELFKNPRYDKVCITTLFTFHWKITIETINFVKQLCKNNNDVMVGGIMSSLLPEKVFEATGIRPHIGLLNNTGVIDKNDIIIDELPLDYSILEEIDYKYPANNAYFAYMTRGCVNKCSFCAVPKLEPKYCDYIGLKNQIEYTNKRFGEKRNLLLLDNNVLASECFNEIIDEIKECGFAKDAKYIPQNEYEIAIQNLKASYNDRAYIRKMVFMYKELIVKLHDEEKKELYSRLEESHCLMHYTATKEKILKLDNFVAPLFKKHHKPNSLKRIVDFNQGVDARLVTNDKMKKLSEICIDPLRIAFDHWSLKNIYIKAIECAVNSGIKNLSNYLLYNFEDKPEDLYNRIKINVELCEKFDASIYSFPMKYHPISDENFFMNRNYIGKYWNRKFIRAIQAVLNATKGKIGKGKSFFEEAFGQNIEQFNKILWMPETFIIYRRKFDKNLQDRLFYKYKNLDGFESNLTNEWWEKFSNLAPEKLKKVQQIISLNKFNSGDYECDDKEILNILDYYKIKR